MRFWFLRPELWHSVVVAEEYVGGRSSKGGGVCAPGRDVDAVGCDNVEVPTAACGNGEVQLPVGAAEADSAVGAPLQSCAYEGATAGVACLHVADEVAQRVYYQHVFVVGSAV